MFLFTEQGGEEISLTGKRTFCQLLLKNLLIPAVLFLHIQYLLLQPLFFPPESGEVLLQAVALLCQGFQAAFRFLLLMKQFL